MPKRKAGGVVPARKTRDFRAFFALTEAEELVARLYIGARGQFTAGIALLEGDDLRVCVVVRASAFENELALLIFGGAHAGDRALFVEDGHEAILRDGRCALRGSGNGRLVFAAREHDDQQYDADDDEHGEDQAKQAAAHHPPGEITIHHHNKSFQ